VIAFVLNSTYTVDTCVLYLVGNLKSYDITHYVRRYMIRYDPAVVKTNQSFLIPLNYAIRVI